MKIRALILSAFSIVATGVVADDSITVQLQPANAGAVLELRSESKKPFAGQRTQFQIEQSPDLTQWQPLGDPISGQIGVSDEALRTLVAAPNPNTFYRVRGATIMSDQRHPEAAYGYAAEFSRNLRNIGQLPLADFVQRYNPTNQYRAAIDFDPTTSTRWPDFDVDPAVYNATSTNDTPRTVDFRFTEQELAVFKKNGFVVSPRLGSYSFADTFYKIFTNDLPVYVSTDALLQAWHRSYVSILAEIEETYLLASLTNIIGAMSVQIPALASEAQGAPLHNGVLDADFFLTVAKSLLSGATETSQLGQADRVNAALTAINSLQAQPFILFGNSRLVDFSQFQVRGHYEDWPHTQRYFRAVMWCSIIDFRFNSAEDSQSQREFAGAAALNLLLDRADQRDNWLQFDQVVRAFIGLPDAMNFAQLGDLLTAGNLQAPYSNLNDIFARLWTGDLGVQNIRSGYFKSPFSAAQMVLPRSFAFMPQRFTLDSWAMSKIVVDDVIWDENGIPELEDKVMRRIPSALDVAFAVLKNDTIVPEIAARIANKQGRPWRDGLYYQHNLAALRTSVDAQVASYWKNNIYTSWLNCLRQLSTPTTAPEFPQAMQTRAWHLKTINTQLASWTQLRHDTVLYAKQSYAGMIGCDFPDGYVEPRVEFWQALADMAARARAAIDTLPTNGVSRTQYWDDVPNSFLQARRKDCFDRFIAASTTLKNISIKELQKQPLTDDEKLFLKDIVEQTRTYNSGLRTYSGWYARLFYRLGKSTFEPEMYDLSDKWDALVTDVHTDPRDEYTGDPGCVLHQAVGNVHMLFIAVDCGAQQPRMFAGPVLSHYEFEQPANIRKTDSEWKAQVKAGDLPPSPEWTQTYLVPGPFTVPSRAN
jgi:hypothetical protein